MITNLKVISLLAFAFFISLAINGCNKDNTVTSTDLTDNQYVQSVVTGGYDNSCSYEDNLASQENIDMNDGYAVSDDENGPLNNPIDSLKKWGRIITGVNTNFNIQNSGDTLKTINVTKTITGIYRIVGWHNGGVLDSINKPYTTVLNRTVIFKRVARSPRPMFNWRVYQISNLDGQTTQPQIGSSQVMMTKIEVYRNGSQTPAYVFNGPDFNTQLYTTIMFGGNGIPSFSRGEQITVKVYTTSQLAPQDYVAYHWAKNTFGFHRVKFTLESQTGNGPYYRVYSKIFNIYSQHRPGLFNAYISANTRESLYDDDLNKFASDEVGIPFKILQ